MSSGNPCSVPPFLRSLGIVAEETPEQQRACGRHDDAYERGGDEEARCLADAEFLVDLLHAKMDHVSAERYFQFVRTYGVFYFGTERARKMLWDYSEPDTPEAP